MTYTFETVWRGKAGLHYTRRDITAPTETIAWEQLGKKVKDDPVLLAQYRLKKFRLVGRDLAVVVGGNQ